MVGIIWNYIDTSVHFGQLIARLKLAGGPSERESEFIICIFFVRKRHKSLS